MIPVYPCVFLLFLYTIVSAQAVILCPGYDTPVIYKGELPLHDTVLWRLRDSMGCHLTLAYSKTQSGPPRCPSRSYTLFALKSKQILHLISCHGMLSNLIIEWNVVIRLLILSHDHFSSFKTSLQFSLISKQYPPHDCNVWAFTPCGSIGSPLITLTGICTGFLKPIICWLHNMHWDILRIRYSENWLFLMIWWWLLRCVILSL